MKTGERDIFILMHRMKTDTDIWQQIGRRLHILPFVIFPLSVLQGHDHFNKKRQEDTDEDPVIEIFRHPRHPPDAHQSDEDKQHPRNDRPYKFQYVHYAELLRTGNSKLRASEWSNKAAAAALIWGGGKVAQCGTKSRKL